MKLKSLLVLLSATLALATTGCKNHQMNASLVRTGVAAGVSYSAVAYPQAVPYLRMSSVVICSQASGTNLSPAEVVAAIEASPEADAIKTPEGVIILNGALTLYNGLWESYGADAIANAPTFQLYLKATCDGIHDGLLMNTPTLQARAARTQFASWPLVKF